VPSFINFDKYRNKIAFISEDNKKISYSSLNSEIKKINEKIEKKSLIFILTNNDIECMFMYLAAMKNKSACLLIESTVSHQMLESLIANFSPRYIFSNLKNTSFKNFKKIKNLKKNIIFENLKKKKYKLWSKLSLLLMTSGTTGKPKLARFSFENLNSNAISIAKYSNISSNDTMITTLSPAYSFGLSMINSHLLKGAKILLNNDSIITKQFSKKIEKYKVSTMGGVPFTYEVFDRLNILKKKNYIKKLLQAGGPLNINLQKKFAKICKKKIDFYIMYGQTEASPRISYLPPKKFSKKIGSIGIPIPGGKIKIIDENEKEIKKAYVEGELEYFGKNVFLGYAENINDLKKLDKNKGQLKTGDIAFRDKDGFYFISGRTKRIIKIFGKRVNLDNIEKYFNKLKIKNACISKKDTLVVFVIDKKNIVKIKNILVKDFNLNKVSFNIKLIKEIFRLKNGKINYSYLSDLNDNLKNN
jgi:long-chain acyl-CoA synthetase